MVFYMIILEVEKGRLLHEKHHQTASSPSQTYHITT